MSAFGATQGRHHHHHHRHHRRRHAATSATCAGSELIPSQQNLQQVDEATVCLINRERTAHGVAPLIDDPRLTGAAAEHSRDMVARDYFGHDSPSGQTPLDRVRASGFIGPSARGFTVGENIAWGTLWLGTPRQIVHSWMLSAGHRENLLDGRFRYTGVGIAPAVPGSLSGGQAGAVYTQDFAAISR